MLRVSLTLIAEAGAHLYRHVVTGCNSPDQRPPVCGLCPTAEGLESRRGLRTGSGGGRSSSSWAYATGTGNETDVVHPERTVRTGGEGTCDFIHPSSLKRGLARDFGPLVSAEADITSDLDDGIVGGYQLAHQVGITGPREHMCHKGRISWRVEQHVLRECAIPRRSGFGIKDEEGIVRARVDIAIVDNPAGHVVVRFGEGPCDTRSQWLPFTDGFGRHRPESCLRYGRYVRKKQLGSWLVSCSSVKELE